MTTWSMEKVLALVPFAQRKSFDLDIPAPQGLA